MIQKRRYLLEFVLLCTHSPVLPFPPRPLKYALTAGGGVTISLNPGTTQYEKARVHLLTEEKQCNAVGDRNSYNSRYFSETISDRTKIGKQFSSITN